MKRNTFILCFSLLVLSTSALWGQQQPAPAAQQPDVGALEQRLKEMEERIISLEGQVRQLKAQAAQPAAAETGGATTAGTAPTVPPESAPAAQAQGVPPPGQQGPVPTSGGAAGLAKALNPDISVIGDFLGSIGKNVIRPVPSMEMHETEVGFQSIIDPYARGDFFLSFGEEGVTLEEGYITFTALPAGFVARVGKMRAAFGKVNTLHNHALPWTDRPYVTDDLVAGEEGIDDAGFSITRAFAGPKGIFLEATGQLFRGDSPDVFHAETKRDVSTVAHLRGYRDITESTNVDIGLSYARGHNRSDIVGGDPFFGITSLYGTDATIRWKPLRRAIYHSFIGRGEFIWSQRQQPLSLGGFQRAFGFYTSADYQLGRRWFVGGRYDHSDRARNAAQVDSGGSIILTYLPSEFSLLRAQYQRANYAEGMNANELRLQVQFALGAHGAHPF